MPSDTTATPQVLWAQRKDVLLVSIVLSDVKEPKIVFQPDNVDFSGVGGPDQKPYAVHMELYAEIDPEKSSFVVRDRLIELKLQKKDSSGKFWPRLLKSSAKAGWLKTNFDLWKDEDEDEDNLGGGYGDFGGGFGGGDNGDLESMMQQMGGMGGRGVGGDDSDEDDMPPLSGSKGSRDEEEESDDEMPKLE